MRLQLKAKHFKGTHFLDGVYTGVPACKGCAIERALAEVFPKERIHEYTDECRVGSEFYSHKEYNYELFEKDKLKAKNAHYSNSVIRTISIPGLKLPYGTPFKSKALHKV